MKYKSKYAIAVSGAAVIKHCLPNAQKISKELGREIIQRGAILITGATTGIPYWAAVGAKEVKRGKGVSIGFSPAASEAAHRKTYRLPVDCFDVIVYTGFGYSGRNFLMTRAADAVIVACGRIGTLNEFTTAFDDNKPIGVLEGLGGTTDMIRAFLKQGYRGTRHTIFDKDPKKLVRRLIKLVEENKKKYSK